MKAHIDIFVNLSKEPPIPFQSQNPSIVGLPNSLACWCKADLCEPYLPPRIGTTDSTGDIPSALMAGRLVEHKHVTCHQYWGSRRALLRDTNQSTKRNFCYFTISPLHISFDCHNFCFGSYRKQTISPPFFNNSTTMMFSKVKAMLSTLALLSSVAMVAADDVSCLTCFVHDLCIPNFFWLKTLT